jgi:hypothetical protein
VGNTCPRGHCLIYYCCTDKETYATITEEEIVAILKEQELTEEEFSALVDRLSSYNETKS